MAKRAKTRVITVRRDRFGRSNKRGLTVTKVRVPLRTPTKPPRAVAPPPSLPAPAVPQPSLLDYMLTVLRTPQAPVYTARWTPGPGVEQEFGFNLREVGSLDPARFVGKGEATMNVTVTRFVDGEPVTIEKVVTFDTGEDDDDFWRNYHEGLREAIDESWDDFQADYPDLDREDGSDSASVAVGAIAA